VTDPKRPQDAEEGAIASVAAQSAFSKLKRAFALRDEFRDLLADALSAPRDVSRRDNSADHTSRIVRAEWVLESQPDYTAAALLLGDVVHNLRAAMDHVMWAITPREVQQQSPTDVSFPLYTQKDIFERWGERRRTWYGPTVFEVLRSYQPFQASGTGKLHPLHILQFLSNTDKHRLLNIVAHNQVNLGGVRIIPEPPGGVRSTINTGLISRGSVLARVEFRRPADTASVELNPVFAYEQVLRYVDYDDTEHRLPIGDALNQIGPDVVEAVGYTLSAHERDSER
jgi:hypothetical protein